MNALDLMCLFAAAAIVLYAAVCLGFFLDGRFGPWK